VCAGPGRLMNTRRYSSSCGWSRCVECGEECCTSTPALAYKHTAKAQQQQQQQQCPWSWLGCVTCGMCHFHVGAGSLGRLIT
jgi:hypothetical protein